MLVAAALDEESRNRFITVIVTIFVAVFLFIAAIVYIITNPLDAIEEYFSEEELKLLVDFLGEYGHAQTVDVSNEDYVESSIYDFSDITFVDNAMEVVYYNQADSRWGDKLYGKSDTIGGYGCGPTSLSIVVSTLTDEQVNPVEMCSWAYENGYWAEGAGSYHSLIPEGAKHFGLKVEGADAKDAEKLVNALAEGKLIIAIMGRGHFTTSGHFLVLRGITSEGKVLIADPISLKKSQKEWDLEIFLEEAKKGAAADGPFWIINK